MHKWQAAIAQKFEFYVIILADLKNPYYTGRLREMF